MTLCEPTIETPEPPALDLPEGVPPLTSFYLYLTNGCNLACRHCWITPRFVNGEPDPGECLDLDLLKGAVAEAKPLGLRSAKLTGGEPTLHPRFVEIADYLTSEGLSLTMETNGTLIDEPLARHLKEKTNLWHVSVSLDGPDAASHDPFRGVPGAFEKAVRGLRALAAAGFKPQVIMSVHRGNMMQMGAVVRLAVASGAGSVKFNPVTRSGRGITMHERGEALEAEEVVLLAHLVRGKLQEQAPIRLILNTPLAFYTVKEFVETANDGMCQVRHILGILGDGSMALCGIGRNVPELVYGKLGKDSLAKIWKDHPMLLELRAELDGPYSGICGQCVHARRCLTYCVAQNYLDQGKLVAPSWLCYELQSQGQFPTARDRNIAVKSSILKNVGDQTQVIWFEANPKSIDVHASAVNTSEGAWIFLGPSGTGKSTLKNLLSNISDPISEDRVGFVMYNDAWYVISTDSSATNNDNFFSGGGKIPGFPLKKIFKLYQTAGFPSLYPLQSLAICEQLMKSFFEIHPASSLDVEGTDRVFKQFGAIARLVSGFDLYFDMSQNTVTILASLISKIQQCNL